MKKNLFLPLFLVIVLSQYSTLLADELPPIGLPDADNTVPIDQLKSVDEVEWYYEDLRGLDDNYIRMDCSQKEIQALGAFNLAAGEEFDFRNLENGWLNICVPVQKTLRRMGQVNSFKIDPPVYVHTDFAKPLNIIFPNLFSESEGADDKVNFYFVEDIMQDIDYNVEYDTDGIPDGQKKVGEEWLTVSLDYPKLTWTVKLIDGFGKVWTEKSVPITEKWWQPTYAGGEAVRDLRAIMIDPGPASEMQMRANKFRDPPMAVSVTLEGDGFAVAHGIAYLVPANGLDALPAPADIAWYMDAASGVVTMDWATVPGADGYKVIRADYWRSDWSAYNGIPSSYEWGNWSMDQFLPPENSPDAPLYLAPGEALDRLWTDVGHSWQEDPTGPFLYVSAVGPPQEQLGGKPLPGRLSRTTAVNADDITPVKGEDGEFRVVGPIIQGKRSRNDFHGINDSPTGGMRTLKGFAFGPEPGSLSIDGEQIPWERIVQWSGELVQFIVGAELVEDATVEVVDWNGLEFPTRHNVIATIPALGEPAQTWFVPGKPFAIPWKGGDSAPPEFLLKCNNKLAPEGDIIISPVDQGDELHVSITYADGITPCYQCRCELMTQVEAEDGKDMADPHWYWPMMPLVVSPGKTIAASLYPDGAVWFGAISNGSYFQVGYEGRAGPPPVLMKDAETLAWDFGDRGRDVLTATDMASILAMLKKNGQVMLIGQFFLSFFADGDADHFAWKHLGLKGSRAVRLTDHLDIPSESPAYEFYPEGVVPLKEDCWSNVAYLPEVVDNCTVVMTTETSKATRPAVIVCDGNLLISGIRFACFDESAMPAWEAVMEQ
jgi:hypothetical protein